jgi:hypothetical protein
MEGGCSNAMHLLLYPWERKLTPTIQEAGQVPELVWKGAENLAPPKIQSLRDK